MTTVTIILITWFLAGLVANVLIARNIKEDITVRDILPILLTLIMGYFSLFFTLIILSLDYITLPKFKLPKGNKVIWKYPKKN